MESILGFFEKGGFIVWIIFGFSVVGLAIFLERVYALRRDRILPQNLLSRVTQLVSDKKMDEALHVCSVEKTGIARIISEILNHRTLTKAELRSHIEDIGRQETQRLSQNVGFLGLTASICPLLGLLGTVYGMIETFSVIEQIGVGEATKLAGGIALALYTTAAGLTVAIPALMGYRFITNRIQSIITSMEAYASQVLERL